MERGNDVILAMIVLGLAAGWVAQLVLGSGRQIDWQMALVTGLIGSFVGGSSRAWWQAMVCAYARAG